jgi:hypothetical protein
MKRAQSVDIKAISLDGFTPAIQVHNRYSLSVLSIGSGDLTWPTMPQDQ